MTVSKIIAGHGTNKNHRERRHLAKRLQPQSFCTRHNHPLSLHGTQLICDVCRIERRQEKLSAKTSVFSKLFGSKEKRHEKA